MSGPLSALYTGTVMHRRTKPHAHRLKYRVFSLLVDLNAIDRSDRLKLLSWNRFNLFSFYDKDFGNRTNEPLRDQIERDLRDAGLEQDDGSIRLFAMPRLLGYAFNPLSVYFCYRRDATLNAIIYEVHNTFGERHSYLIPVAAGARQDSIRQRCAKRLYVSPFMEMDMSYSFRIVAPGDRVAISIQASDANGPVMTAVLSADRQDLTDAALLRAFVFYPLLTLKVIAGIHWEALLIWFKGMRLVNRPPPPSRPVTVVTPPSSPGKIKKDFPVHVLR